MVESFLDHSCQSDEQAITFAALGRSVHDGQSFRLKIGQRTEKAFVCRMERMYPASGPCSNCCEENWSLLGGGMLNHTSLLG
jgi:hypothetical protein